MTVQTQQPQSDALLRAIRSRRPFTSWLRSVLQTCLPVEVVNDELAASTQTHPPTLYRLLRALASVDVFRELDGHCFELTALGERLRSNVADSIAGWAMSSVARTIGRHGLGCSIAFVLAKMHSSTSTLPMSGRTGRAVRTRMRSSIVL